MRRFIVAAIASLVVAAFAAVPAAATSTGNRGQPNQDCEASSGGTAPGLRHRRLRERPEPLRRTEAARTATPTPSRSTTSPASS